MKVKMIATDLDGTLLRSDKTMSDYTKTILRGCREKGIKVVYATGRGTSAEKLMPAELFDGKITMNGAVAKIDGTIVYRCTIPYAAARPLLAACCKRGLKTVSEISGMHHSNFDIAAEWPNFNEFPNFFGDFKMVDFDTHSIDAEKIYVVTKNPEDIAFIESHMPNGLYLSMNMGYFAMVMHKEASKSRAIAELAKIWGINQSEIVSFGDDFNDLDMLQWTGFGVAVENAIPEAKAAADFICKGNNKDGVARWLRDNVL
jgi:hypothetical protein